MMLFFSPDPGCSPRSPRVTSSRMSAELTSPWHRASSRIWRGMSRCSRRCTRCVCGGLGGGLGARRLLLEQIPTLHCPFPLSGSLRVEASSSSCLVPKPSLWSQTQWWSATSSRCEEVWSMQGRDEVKGGYEKEDRAIQERGHPSWMG